MERDRSVAVKVFTLVIACAILPVLCDAAEPPKPATPGSQGTMHTAVITTIAADPDNRYLVTGSEDKTVRVWDLPTGRLLRVITPPAGQGDEGKIFALAISPDGKTIACGGYTGSRKNTEQEGKTYYDVYIYERESGTLLHKLPVPYVVEGLVYSRDGAFLVSTSRGAFESTSTDFGSDRIFATAVYRRAKDALLPSVGAVQTFADFDGQGRLLVIQKFGVWNMEIAGKGGSESRVISGIPTSVSFSPDGSRIALGFADSTVGVYSGQDLSLLYKPDVKSIGPAEVEFTDDMELAEVGLSTVVWSFDGTFLYYAGGRTCANGSCFIRKWSDGGRGPFKDLTAASSRITHLVALQKGGVAYAAVDPAFGVLDAQDTRTLFLENRGPGATASKEPTLSEAKGFDKQDKERGPGDEKPATGRGCYSVSAASFGIIYKPGKWGYLDKDGKAVIHPQFDYALPFSEGLAIVGVNDKLGFIDKTGRIIIKPTFAPPVGNFHEGLAVVNSGGKYGYIDKTGNMVIQPQFRWVGDFSEGLATVNVSGKQGYGYIDKSGKLVIRSQFDQANPFSEGVAAVLKKGKWGYIDKTGKTVIARRFDAAWPFAEGLARVREEPCRNRCEEGYIDKTGTIVIRGVRPTHDGSFSDGRAMIYSQDYGMGFIDKQGKIVVSPDLEQAGPFAEGLAAVKKGGQWAYIDKQGLIAIKPKFEEASAFSEGLATVLRNGKWGYIDKTGKIAIPPQFDNSKRFSEGLAAVCVREDSDVRLQPAAPPSDAIPNISEGHAMPSPVPPGDQGESSARSASPALSESDVKELAELHQKVGELSQKRRYVEALPLARRAVDLVEESVEADDPAVVQPVVDLARVQHALGEYRRAAGDSVLSIEEYRNARSLYERAVAIQERRLGADSPELAELLDDQGALLRAMREYDEAADVFQRVLALRTNALGPDDPRTAKAISDLAALRVMKYTANQRFIEAFASAQTALEHAERALGPDHPSVGLALANLAELYRSFRATYIKASADLHERALAVRERSLGPDHWEVVMSLRSLGEIYAARQGYGNAARVYARALSIEEKVLGPDHPAIATFVKSLAEVHLSPGQYADAEHLYQRVLAIHAKEDKAYKVARALVNLGDLYRATGQHAKAEPLFTRALSLREQNMGPKHFKTAETLRRLGTVYRVRGDYTQAQPLYERAAAIHQKDGGSSLAAPWALRDLAALAAAQQDYRSALRFLTESLAAEKPRRNLGFGPGTEEKHLEFTASRYVSGSYFFFLSLVSRHIKDDPQAVRKGIEFVLRRKGVVFDTQSMARASSGEQSQVAQQKRDALSAARTELSALLLHKPKAMAEEAYREKLALAFERTNTLEQALAYLPSSLAREFPDQSITVDTVAAVLPKGSALLEFVKIPDFDYAREDFDFPKREWSASSRYLAFILNQSGKVVLVDLGLAGELEAAAALVFKDMRDREAIAWSQHLTDLYTRLWAPLEGALRGVDKVIISPDGSLNFVPFAALIDNDGRFLVERYLVAYVNTARELLATEPPPAPPASDLLLVANPAFDTEASGSPGWSADFQSRDFHQRFNPLGGTQREASEIPPLISDTHGQTILVGTKATEGAVKSVRSPRILHLATHGFFLPDQEFGMDEARYENSLVRSGLALAGANRAAQAAEGEDGLLTALEVTGIDLSGTFLVVLSACNTGVGEVKAGEGVVGLRRAFALAGAKNLMMSLWPVGDAITADEMKLFYRNLQKMAPAEALRQAQLDTIRELKARDGHASPQLWAPFILQGGHALSVAAN